MARLSAESPSSWDCLEPVGMAWKTVDFTRLTQLETSWNSHGILASRFDFFGKAMLEAEYGGDAHALVLPVSGQPVVVPWIVHIG